MFNKAFAYHSFIEIWCQNMSGSCFCGRNSNQFRHMSNARSDQGFLPCHIIMYDKYVTVNRRKIALNCLKSRCNKNKRHHFMFRQLYYEFTLLFIAQKFPFKTHINSYISKGRHFALIYANFMLGLPVISPSGSPTREIWERDYQQILKS